MFPDGRTFDRYASDSIPYRSAPTATRAVHRHRPDLSRRALASFIPPPGFLAFPVAIFCTVSTVQCKALIQEAVPALRFTVETGWSENMRLTIDAIDVQPFGVKICPLSGFLQLGNSGSRCMPAGSKTARYRQRMNDSGDP